MLPERVRIYGDFITALEDALVAGIAAAERASTADQPTTQPSMAHLTELLDQIGARDVPVRQSATDAGWDGARTAADRAGARAVLVTADDGHHTTMQAALFTLWGGNPVIDPISFLREYDNTTGAGDADSDLRRARLDVQLAALHEIGFGSHTSAHG